MCAKQERPGLAGRGHPPLSAQASQHVAAPSSQQPTGAHYYSPSADSPAEDVLAGEPDRGEPSSPSDPLVPSGSTWPGRGLTGPPALSGLISSSDSSVMPHSRNLECVCSCVVCGWWLLAVDVFVVVAVVTGGGVQARSWLGAEVGHNTGMRQQHASWLSSPPRWFQLFPPKSASRAPVPDLRQARAPLEVANKQVFDGAVGAAGQQHGYGLPVVTVAGLGLQGVGKGGI